MKIFITNLLQSASSFLNAVLAFIFHYWKLLTVFIILVLATFAYYTAKDSPMITLQKNASDARP
jgi:hypothetical protein